MLLGTLSNDDDDSAENVTKKMNLCSFKLSQVYMDPLNMPSAGDVSWSWILKILFKFIQWTSKKCTKKRDDH